MAGETNLDLDFESGSFSAWTGVEEYNAHQHTVVTTPVRSPRTRAGYFEVHSGDVWPGNNTVRCLAQNTLTHETTGQDYYWAISFRVPSSVSPLTDELIWELHHPSSLYNIPGLGVAPYAVHVAGGVIRFRVATGSGVLSQGWPVWYPNQALGTLAYDTWISVLVHISFTEAASGTVEVWLDTTGSPPANFGAGTPTFSLSGVATMPYYNGGGGYSAVHDAQLYTEAGLYTGTGSIGKQDVVYIDGIWRRTTKAAAVAKLTGGTSELDSEPAGWMGGTYATSGTTQHGSQANKQRCYKVTVSKTGTVTAIGHYREPAAVAGTETVKLAVWPDGGAGTDPGTGALKGQTAEVAFTQASVWQRYSTALVSGFAVTAGDVVWVGEINGGTPNIAVTRKNVVSGAFRLMDATYSGGPIMWSPSTDATVDLDMLMWLEGTPSVGSPPVNLTAPTVIGTTQVGDTLSVSGDGTWSGPTPTIAYQWQRDNTGAGAYTSIAGASSATYALTAQDAHCNMRCRVTATNADGSATASSNTVGLVTAAAARTAGTHAAVARTVAAGRRAAEGGGGG